MNINKSDISNKIASDVSISKSDSKLILDFFLSVIRDNLKYKKIKLGGFGSFENKETKERLGRNPKTKESYVIKSYNKTYFNASKIVRKVIN
jgi:nucleoid DNA-binding protein